MSLTIITYHYVRDEGPPPFRGLKARTVAEFDRQLDYIGKHFTVVAAEDVLAALDGAPLQDDAAWLTFDDGYIDHYEVVFPRLLERGWQGSFFPCVSSSKLGRLLDVNKVQMIVASGLIEVAVDGIRQACGDQFNAFWEAHAKPSKFDPAAVRFVKMMLQTVLPEPSRTSLMNHLFRSTVSQDEADIAGQLYASAPQLQTMRQSGMYIGFHGAEHVRLGGLGREGVETEVESALQFLTEVGASTDPWVACYPYGSHDDECERVLLSNRCKCGLTVENAVARIDADHPMRLPRVDTNFLPH